MTQLPPMVIAVLASGLAAHSGARRSHSFGVMHPGQGSQYALAFIDADGDPLDGGKNYRLHLPPNTPVNNFWSVIVYDNQTRSQLQNGQTWPSVSSLDTGFHANDDGSVDVWFGPNAPDGEDGNWVQTLPGKGWNVILRLYGPLDPWFDKTWRPSEIELCD